MDLPGPWKPPLSPEGNECSHGQSPSTQGVKGGLWGLWGFVFDVHKPFVGVFGPGQIRGLRGCVKRYVDVTYLRDRKSDQWDIDTGYFQFMYVPASYK